MKTATLPFALLGLLLWGHTCEAQYPSQQYQSQIAPRYQGQANRDRNRSWNEVGSNPQQQTPERYPLIQPPQQRIGVGTSPQVQLDRNVIQQPQLYGVNGIHQNASGPVPRVFAHQNQQPAATRVANNYPTQPNYPQPNYPQRYPAGPTVGQPSGSNGGNYPALNGPTINNSQRNPAPAALGNALNQYPVPNTYIARVQGEGSSQLLPQPAGQDSIIQQPLVQQPMVQQPMGQQPMAPGGLTPQPMGQNQPAETLQPGNSMLSNQMDNSYGYGYGYGSEAGKGFGIGRGFGMGHRGHCRERRCFEPRPCCGCGPWFGSIGALLMYRDFEDDLVLIQPDGDPITNSLVTTDADPGLLAGFEVMAGFRFCGCYGIQGVYWGLFSEDATATLGNQSSGSTPVTVNTFLSTANYLDFQQTSTTSTDVTTFVNSNPGVRLIRANDFHNLELNLLRCSGCGETCDPCGGCGTGCGMGGCGDACCRPRCGCRPFCLNLIAGVRFFQFNEGLAFQADTVGNFANDIGDLNYDLDVDNTLVGVQVGSDVYWRLLPRWRFFGGTRFGVFGNSINHVQQIFGRQGFAVSNVGAFTGQPYNIQSTKTEVSLLGQLDFGINYDITQRWSAGFGYRIVAINGVALAAEQIPRNFADYQEAAAINSNSGLILHGMFWRVQYDF